MTFVQVNTGSRYARYRPIGYDVTDAGCWEWRGERLPDGYGRIRINGKKVSTHRHFYEQKYGPVPDGLQLDHVVCDNPPCCNPDHVKPVPQRVNLMRGNGACARHARQTHCLRGHLLAGDNLCPTRLLQGARICLQCRVDRYYESRR